MHCYTCSSYFSSHKVVVILIKKQFSFIFLKIKNTKNYFFVSGTAKTAHKAMYVSFVLLVFLINCVILVFRKMIICVHSFKIGPMIDPIKLLVYWITNRNSGLYQRTGFHSYKIIKNKKLGIYFLRPLEILIHIRKFQKYSPCYLSSKLWGSKSEEK
jgi:hypothetical protein